MISFSWIQKNEEVGKVVEALDDIEDIVTKEALIVELKRVTHEKYLIVHAGIRHIFGHNIIPK